MKVKITAAGYLISIHALVKRATSRTYWSLVSPYIISIHALVKRATLFYLNCAYGANISIHALVKRATNFATHICNPNLHFNPRPREEGDLIIYIS